MCEFAMNLPVFSFYILENKASNSPSFYLSICSSVDSENIQSSISTSPNANTGSLLYYTDSSAGKNATLGEANSKVRYSDGELIQLEYTNGEECYNGRKVL